MSNDIAIRVTNLSKLYHLGEHAARAPYKTLRDSLTGLFRRTPTARSLTESTEITKVKSHSSADTDGRTASAAGNAGTPVKPSPSPTSVLPVSPVRDNSDLLWALKDVNFTINRGEVVGIIGRNGAGKSTLLKILSRITDPTEGQAELHGRVGSLLEVGTGFHPELTGRENIYLNGAILGMKRAEISKNFDEIVAFAEVEKFIDTPVKFYSSGMYVRLAFAVAAHLEPEILLVDEVLAVGDTAFQKKCLGKMGDVAKQGRTVLFVSHNMGAVADLCKSAIVLNNGTMALMDKTDRAIQFYMDKLANPNGNAQKRSLTKHPPMAIAHVSPKTTQGQATATFTHKDPIVVEFHLSTTRWTTDAELGFFVRDHRGRKVFTPENYPLNEITENRDSFTVSCIIPGNFLVPGAYTITGAITVHGHAPTDVYEDACSFSIIDAGSIYARYEGFDYGCVFAQCKWLHPDGKPVTTLKQAPLTY